MALDFGANIGVWTLLFAKKSKFVHAVEPHPNFRKRLVENLGLNRLKNCEIHSCAVSRRAGKTALFSPPEEMKNKSASILNLNSQLSEEIEVNLRTMDSMFNYLDDVNFIKIDCDGSDADIILSGKEIIKKHKPIILFEDLGGCHAAMGSEDLIDLVDSAYDEAFDMLENLGYGMFNVLNGLLKRTGRIRGDYSNILAIPMNNFLVEIQNV